MGNKGERIVKITTEPVELYKILKFENIASSGGEAKYMIADGMVIVNGEEETRKRRKIYNGDVIQVLEEVIKIEI